MIEYTISIQCITIAKSASFQGKLKCCLSAIYTYSQYQQPIAGDTLYPIPGGTKLEDEIKLRVENQDSTPGQG